MWNGTIHRVIALCQSSTFGSDQHCGDTAILRVRDVAEALVDSGANISRETIRTYCWI
jgi:hypothetical protein